MWLPHPPRVFDTIATFLILHKHLSDMQKFEQLKSLVASLEEDFDKFYNKENGTAGTRVRKAMQDLKTLAQEIRTEVQETKNKETK
jgi:hypothetical protein